ncbi:hypothetical protein [Dyadobacter arcticus]|uniref:Membrane protein involved in the export of O-antigen and teichoic acid n=1 Tax=Dyadobacter arcticus TaxID=1078754 RepID=A0ABX0UJS6_9BACT|nr:hypothetical protein [Dyadobacter arcticus]NIJ53186.1 hypothetical protein [Dyadobacter arcticus]
MKTLMLSTVSAFFRQRAGMFFVFLGILFGFLSGAEHHAFAVFFLTGSYGMAYLFGIWLAYTILCAQFLIQTWKLPTYTFVYNARIWPAEIRLIRFALLALGFLQPILFYGIYLISISVQDKILSRLWPVIPFYLFFIFSIAFIAEWRVRNPVLYVAKTNNSFFKSPFPRPVSWLYWAIEWMFREKGITMLAGKLGAVLVSVGTMLYYSTDNYDIRLPAVGLSLAYMLNLGISYEFFKWESQVWLWGRSMPVSNARRFLRILAFHAIIILPETLAAMRNGPLNFVEIIQLYLLGLALITLSHLFFYRKNGIQEDSMGAYLFGFIGLTLLILYKIPLLMIAGAAIVFSFFVFPKWYKV